MHTGSIRIVAVILAVVGVVMVGAGAATWITVQSQLGDEKITVADDADWLAGNAVNNPFTAYAEAQAIKKHALEATGGKTYAQLDRNDPLRDTAMSASFLRASLFTSVVSFGVAALAGGVGIVLILLAWALFAVAGSLNRLATATPAATPGTTPGTTPGKRAATPTAEDG